MNIADKPLHTIIEKVETGVGNAAALTFLWILSKYPDGVTSDDVAAGRGVTKNRASKWLADLRDDRFLIEGDRNGRNITFTINWERL